MTELESVAEPRRAAMLLDPLRLRILVQARRPASAADIAGRLRLPRQKVNYHVRQLARARFLRRAGRFRKRNMIEQRYQATAAAYVLAPQVLGPLGAGLATVQDAFSAFRLLALASQVQSDLTRVTRAAASQGKRLATLSAASDIHFESAEQRQNFTRALEKALVDIVARHTSTAGRPFRLVLGCYPIPQESPHAHT